MIEHTEALIKKFMGFWLMLGVIFVKLVIHKIPWFIFFGGLVISIVSVRQGFENYDGCILQGRWNIGKLTHRIPNEYSDFAKQKRRGFNLMIATYNAVAFVITCAAANHFQEFN